VFLHKFKSVSGPIQSTEAMISVMEAYIIGYQSLLSWSCDKQELAWHAYSTNDIVMLLIVVGSCLLIAASRSDYSGLCFGISKNQESICWKINENEMPKNDRMGVSSSQHRRGTSEPRRRALVPFPN
jgi:hypothetical protein